MSTVPETSRDPRGRSASPKGRRRWGHPLSHRQPGGRVRSSSAPPVKLSELLRQSLPNEAAGRPVVTRWASSSLADFMNSAQGGGHHSARFPAECTPSKSSLKKRVVTPGDKFTAKDPPFALNFEGI